ncbi:MAG: energy-coupling factor transporter ATPase [Clostridiales bacterium]|nr:energy-coupling factor transporter ATPase [Clostridiales bacterium]
MDIIKVENVDFSYVSQNDNGKQISNKVLKNINIDIPEGQFLAVLGHNGCGKSTMAKLFNGLLIPQSGKVFVDGIDTADENRIFDVRQTVGMVFQNPDNQIVATIVEEDVAFALENLGVLPNEIRKRVDESLKTVGMYEYRDHAPHKLSGGQKQRVAIAGVLAMRPKCLVLDEPTAMLDPKGRKEIIKTIKMLNKDFGTTVILITHYMEEAAQADRVVVMEQGEVVLDNIPERIFSQVEFMKKIGLDVPQTIELFYELNKNGFSLNLEILDIEEQAEQLADAIKGGNYGISN